MADLCILTADNSRYEKVEDILEDIRKSVEKAHGAYMLIPDRREAIAYSIRNAEEGDMIAVIGKGHETTLQRGGEALLTVPVTALVLLLLLAFWVVLPLMIVALFCGCRFYFTGPDLGREDINDAMGKATEAADSLKKEFRSGDGA